MHRIPQMMAKNGDESHGRNPSRISPPRNTSCPWTPTESIFWESFHIMWDDTNPPLSVIIGCSVYICKVLDAMYMQYIHKYNIYIYIHKEPYQCPNTYTGIRYTTIYLQKENLSLLFIEPPSHGCNPAVVKNLIKTYLFCKLVGGWTSPFEKYARQISESSPSGDENKKYLKPPPSKV